MPAALSAHQGPSTCSTAKQSPKTYGAQRDGEDQLNQYLFMTRRVAEITQQLLLSIQISLCDYNFSPIKPDF